VPEFAKRFEVDVMTWYGSSEAPVPIQSEWNSPNLAACGQLVDGFEARIVDDHDRDVADGETGELVLRHVRPWTISPGYWRNDEATVRLWRNGWMHTGDAMRRDPEGNFYFIDRKKDAIRRRGENISSFEVERDVLSHPDVREAAAIGIPNSLGDEDVLIAVVLKPDTGLSEAELFGYLRPRMAHFMLPRYVRFMETMPKTATDRAQKFVLREQGVTPDTWDRETAGIIVKREKI
jgi:carnitine-CoA ligase